jgi:hypothetical protein
VVIKQAGVGYQAVSAPWLTGSWSQSAQGSCTRAASGKPMAKPGACRQLLCRSAAPPRHIGTRRAGELRAKLCAKGCAAGQGRPRHSLRRAAIANAGEKRGQRCCLADLPNLVEHGCCSYAAAPVDAPGLQLAQSWACCLGLLGSWTCDRHLLLAVRWALPRL